MSSPEQFKDRLASSLALWMLELRKNLMDVWASPVSILPKPPFKSQVGLAIASGPSVLKNIELVANLNPLDPKVVLCCADRAAWSFGERIPAFYVASTEHSPLIRGFYNKMAKPIAAVLSCFASHEVVKVLLDRQIRHYYYCPAFGEDDKEFKLLNQVLQDLTGAPLMYGIGDTGQLAWRVLTGLGCKKIGLVGYDYGEPVDRKFEDWSLYEVYKKWMKDHDLSKDEMFKQAHTRQIRNEKTGTSSWTDSTWDAYREKFKILIREGEKQGIKTVNATEGGTIDFIDCQTLGNFLVEEANEKTV